MTLIYISKPPSQAYIEGYQSHIRDLVNVRTIDIANFLRILDHAKVVLPDYVHCTEEAEYGSITDAHLLIDEQVSLIEWLWALELEDARLLPVDDQGALSIINEVYASHLDNYGLIDR